jgi:APA family basic amino acid/polyamine antiporter
VRPPKELGFWMCTALVVGNIIGVGIFVLPASLAPFGLNALAGWGITVAGMAMIAHVFARLARDLPEADGPYDYIRRRLGDPPAFLAIWCYWISLWVTNAALVIGVVGYLQAAIPAASAVPPVVLALSLLWAFVLVNLLGTRVGGEVQVATTVLKLLPLAAIMLLGAGLLLTDPGAYSRHVPATPVTGGDLMAASTVALYAMLGVESATIPAGRVIDPGRTIPRATLAGTFVTAAIYLAVSSIALLLLPQGRLAQSAAPFVDLMNEYSMPGGGRVLAAFIVVSGLGALNGWTLLVGELTCTMSRHGVLPRRLQALNARGAPSAALVVTGLLASAMVAMNFSRSLVQGFTFLTSVVTGANLPLYLFCAIALAAAPRGARAAGPGVKVLGIAGSAYAIFAFVGLGREPFLWAIALAAAGLPLYVLMRARKGA